MPLDVILGAQWGDEGKGKVSTVISAGADYCARFQGGPNAGHSGYIGRRKLEFRMLPAGIASAQVGVIGNGVVVHPETLLQELNEASIYDSSILTRMRISLRAHIVTTQHVDSDRKLHTQSLGTTGRGVGPSIGSKVARTGVRIQDLLSPVGLDLLPVADREAAESLLSHYRKYCVDTGLILREALAAGETVIAEGAQGTFLDIDHGDYPFVTSANTTVGSVFSGLGVGFKQVNRILLVASAYLTKLGRGPFPTRLHGYPLEHLQLKGDEYDASRGEMRACGWLDTYHLRRAAQLNSATGLVITKMDVLSGLTELEVHDTENKACTRVQGWDQDLREAQRVDDFPLAAQDYLEMIADRCHVPIVGVSTGPMPDQYLHCEIGSLSLTLTTINPLVQRQLRRGYECWSRPQ